jgi:hypothetical protein
LRTLTGAAERLVAEHHARRRELLPEKRHERFAPFLRRRPPVALACHVGLVDSGIRLARGRDYVVHAAEELLHAHTVERDEDYFAVRLRHGVVAGGLRCDQTR